MNRTVLIVSALILSLLGVTSAMATEEAKYTLVRKEGVFEIRDYDAHILAETRVEGSLEDASGKAFNRLFKYISGNNQSRNKVAMTAPVSQSPASEKISMTAPVGQQASGNPGSNQWVVSFMMPASYTLATLPKPSDANVTLRLVPMQRVAAIRYSGLWSEQRYQDHKSQLEAWIAKNKLAIVGAASWARYDPPFKPWFMRRNEILIPVTAR
ncbi:MAG TPA: heme-binding protein [Arenimonas sp.]|nr:heme-binding protein [Arenimonas sp.]HOZ04450.1 heme-binding protein [Arenimonas sp.]HPW34098.1 heme-binding protein [Arenimonas sp.]